MGARVNALMVAGALWLGASGQEAQAQAGGCMVQQAADAAVQRQIAMIDAAKVNPSEFFSGANSCIAPALLQRIDLSNFIPSAANFLSSGVESMIGNLIQQAQQKICEALNSQLQQLVGKLNSVGGSFQSQLPGELASILGGSNSFTPVTLPAIGGIGQYDMQSQTGGSLFETVSTPPFVPQGTGGLNGSIINPDSLRPQSDGSSFGTIYQ